MKTSYFLTTILMSLFALSCSKSDSKSLAKKIVDPLFPDSRVLPELAPVEAVGFDCEIESDRDRKMIFVQKTPHPDKRGVFISLYDYDQPGFIGRMSGMDLDGIKISSGVTNHMDQFSGSFLARKAGPIVWEEEYPVKKFVAPFKLNADGSISIQLQTTTVYQDGTESQAPAFDFAVISKCEEATVKMPGI